MLRTLLVHEYRRFTCVIRSCRHRCCPASGQADAHTLCRNLYAKVFGASEEFLSTRVQTLDGALPPPAAEVFARFGGLPRDI